MVVRVLHLPDHSAGPIHINDGADLVWLVRNKTVWGAWGLAVVKKCAPLRQAAILGGIRHLPRMNGRAIKVDQIDGRGFALVGREQGKSGPRAFAIQTPQAGSSSLKFGLLNRQNSTFVTASS